MLFIDGDDGTVGDRYILKNLGAGVIWADTCPLYDSCDSETYPWLDLDEGFIR